MKKGDIVRVKAEVITIYGNPHWIINNPKVNLIHCPLPLNPYETALYRVKSLYEKPVKETFLGILIGKTYLATGKCNGGYEYDDPANLNEDKRHLCWKVEPLLNYSRYLQPILCLEQDLEMFQELNFSIKFLSKSKSKLENNALISLSKDSNVPLMYVE